MALCHKHHQLWFDVEKKTITTSIIFPRGVNVLWFDVEKKTITTVEVETTDPESCGLM